MAADLSSIISAAANQYGVPADYMLRSGQIESSMNPNNVNPHSGAAGLFQFIPSTAQRYGLANPIDPVASADAMARLTRDNFSTLRNGLGRDPTPGELYLAHQQGAGGAMKLLSNPNVPAAALVGDRAVSLNGGQPGMTAGQFSKLWLDKFAGTSAPQAGPTVASTIAGPRPAPMPGLGDMMGGAGGMPNMNGMAMGFMANQEAEHKAKRDQAQATKQAKLAALFAPQQTGGIY